MLIGYCCGIKSIILSIILISAYIILYVPTILYEEKILLEKLGTEFQNYLDTTPRFLPSFSSLQKSKSILLRKLFSDNSIDSSQLGFAKPLPEN